MATIYELTAYRTTPPSTVAPLTRNQQLLAEINAEWAARTPEQILLAEIRGTQEELQSVQRRYDRLIAAWPSELPTPAEIAHDLRSHTTEQNHDIGSGQESSGRNG